jgi:hypothetical protein
MQPQTGYFGESGPAPQVVARKEGAQNEARAKPLAAGSALAVFPGVGAARWPLRRTVISFTVKRPHRQSTQKPPARARCFDPGGRAAPYSRKHGANSEAFSVLGSCSPRSTWSSTAVSGSRCGWPSRLVFLAAIHVFDEGLNNANFCLAQERMARNFRFLPSRFRWGQLAKGTRAANGITRGVSCSYSIWEPT